MTDAPPLSDARVLLLDAYYDTEDWRSYRAGYSLRAAGTARALRRR